jgi:NAD(P)-dependent dehydrogenase (short-subunit alcohol dehydrogenase family)
MLSPSDMTDKSAMVTGAAAGPGRATALLLAEAGANLCLVDIDAKGLAGTAADIRALGREVLVKAVNLAEGSQCPAIPHLLAQNGAVVNVSSCAAHMGQAYLAAYSATKAALNHMTRSLAMEYMHKPIRFNAVAPGGMMTALAAGLAKLPDPDPDLLGRITPLRGVNEVEDVARMVAFLTSDAARGYHGSIINIDNGITAG